MKKITEYNGINTKDLYLEITESAYVSDSDLIVDRVKALRENGFFIEMDDFGSGYSSLNMISALPIDALKLDMMFIRSAFDKHNDTRMISIVIDIADYLGVPVIAEGVETEEQYLALKKLGCAIIQGYYFSKPVPSEEFEKFFTES
jgi:EAL domain-containing protein (putative c-di-GMP-specific phosphodiesterase class I)